jgi:O-antigen/teichoic acid export membrane protein
VLIKTHNNLLKSIASLAGANVTASVLTAIAGILIARYIEPEINGQFRAFTIPLMYLTLLHLGTFDGLYRQIPFYTGLDQPDEVARIAATSGAWNVFVTIIIASGFLLCSLWALWNSNYIYAAGWFTQVLGSISVFYVGYLSATYRTLNHFVVLSKIVLIQAVIGFCLVYAVVSYGFYGFCVRFTLPIIICGWLYHRLRPLPIPLKFEFSVFKDVLKIGAPLCFWGTLYTSLWVAVEFSLVLKFGGVKALGLFSVAVMMRESLSILPQSIHQVLLPRVVESFARKGGVKSAATRSILGTGLFTLLMVGIVLVVGRLLDYFVPLVIPKYIDGLLMMKTCLWIAVIQAMSFPLDGLTATGRGWLYGKGVLVGIFAFLIAFYLLKTYVGGVMAVIIASLIGRFVRTLVAYFDLFSLIRQESKSI